MRPACLSLLFALLAVLDVSATNQLGPQQQLWTAERMTTEVQQDILALQASVDAALARDDGAGAVARLEGARDSLVQQWVAHAVLLGLAGQPRRDAHEPLREWALQQPVTFLRRHEETAADWFLPLIDLAADARNLERGWREQAQRGQWQQRWTNDPRAALRAVAQASMEDQARAGEALALLDATSFARWRTAAAAVAPSEVPVALWLASAQRQSDAEAIANALANGDGEARLAALALISPLPDRAALPLLEQAERDPTLSSAATLALVPRLLAGADHHDQVLTRLADPQRRASAAAALARLDAAPQAKALADLWHGADTEAKRGLRLAAELSALPAAATLKRQWDAESEDVQ